MTGQGGKCWEEKLGEEPETTPPIAFGQQIAEVTLCTSMNMLSLPQPLVN